MSRLPESDSSPSGGWFRDWLPPFNTNTQFFVVFLVVLMVHLVLASALMREARREDERNRARRPYVVSNPEPAPPTQDRETPYEPPPAPAIQDPRPPRPVLARPMAGTLGVEPAEPRASSAMGPPPLETLPESPAADGLPAGMGRLRSVRPLSD